MPATAKNLPPASMNRAPARGSALNLPCSAWADRFSVSRMPAHLLPPRAKAYPIQSGSSPASPISAPCATLKKGRLGHFTIGLCGDLKFGRTVHSLINALVRYPEIHFVFISPPELKVPDYITDMLTEKGISYEEVIRLEECMPDLDMLYMTRVQRERFFNEEDYVRLKDFYILNKAKMALAKDDMLVLHPLPRVNEISVEVDDDPRAIYFKQVQYGVYVRMALILTLLEITV